MKANIALVPIILFAALPVIALDANPGEVYLCMNDKGTKEYKTTGEVAGCKKIDLTGITRALSDWTEIYSDDKISLSVHDKSISKSGKYLKAWIMWSYTQEKKTSSYPIVAYHSTKTLDYFSCSERATATNQVVFYSGFNGAGDSVSSSKYGLAASSFTEVVPDSLGDMTLRHVCRVSGRAHSDGSPQPSSNSAGKPRLSAAELKARANGKEVPELTPEQIKRLGY